MVTATSDLSNSQIFVTSPVCLDAIASCFRMFLKAGWCAVTSAKILFSIRPEASAEVMSRVCDTSDHLFSRGTHRKGGFLVTV